MWKLFAICGENCGEDDFPQNGGRFDSVVRGNFQIDRIQIDDSARGGQQDREERCDENNDDGRQIADPPEKDDERHPGDRCNGAEKLQNRVQIIEEYPIPSDENAEEGSC